MTTHFAYPSEAMQEELRRIANAMMEAPKGILAADECIPTMELRLKTIGLPNTKDNRKAVREVVFTTNNVLHTTDKKLNRFISAIILHEEMVFEKTSKGEPFIQCIKDRKIIPGITLDTGLVPLTGSDNETTTQGLDNLAARCIKYKEAGCDFAKWRCSYKIGEHTPSSLAIQENAHVLARYASICQAHGLVPIVEPDISLDGDHDLVRAQKVFETVMAAVIKALNDHHVFLEGIVLKPNMVTAGNLCAKKYTPEQIGVATVTAIARTVPSAVAGVAFLSGGQSEEEATANLMAICQCKVRKPCRMTFCFGRALQTTMLRTWNGKAENVEAAQKLLVARAEINSLASRTLEEIEVDKTRVHPECYRY